MMRPERFVRATGVPLLILIITGAAARKSMARESIQGDREVRLEINEPRPLIKALRILSEKTGWRITYEDLPLSRGPDVVDKTDPRAAQTTNTRILIPAYGRINLTMYVPEGVNERDGAQFVKRLVDHYALMGNPGIFRVAVTENALHVIPARMRGVSGEMIDVIPILDSRISFVADERTLSETLKQICASLQARRGVRVVLMIGPTEANLLLRPVVKIGANEEEARNVLIRSLDAAGAKLTYNLLWDPGLQMYALNVDDVVIEERTPAGRIRLRPVPPK